MRHLELDQPPSCCLGAHLPAGNHHYPGRSPDLCHVPAPSRIDRESFRNCSGCYCSHASCSSAGAISLAHCYCRCSVQLHWFYIVCLAQSAQHMFDIIAGWRKDRPAWSLEPFHTHISSSVRSFIYVHDFSSTYFVACPCSLSP